MVIDEKGNSRLEIDPKAALEYVMEHFAPSVPGAWASDCIWTVGDALKKAEARIAELESGLSHSILHGLRDRDDDSRIALRRIAERCERAESRVRELEAGLSRMQNLFDEETRLRREATIRAEKAEARVRELSHLLALVEDDVRDAHTIALVRAALAGGKD